MPKEAFFKKIINFVFAKFFRINDSAQKIALGIGLGVFTGLIPGTGPAAALFLALIFRANRAAALLGSILTNTWLSLVTFILAIKLGSVILNLHWQAVCQKAQGLMQDFHWIKFFRLSFHEVLMPVITGYLIIGLFLGIISYFLTLLIIRRNTHGSKTTHL
ncbi:MAG: DUF2062 domain-containing protein [Candidatus Omnitrophica bacterium]|nr:DUF2062 domain-containing protein [Candidatus Omnitrophota bacterium]